MQAAAQQVQVCKAFPSLAPRAQELAAQSLEHAYEDALQSI